MRKTLLVLGMFAPMAFAQTQQTLTYTYSGLPIPIYPDDWNTISAISMFVPRSLSVSKVTVSLTVQYNGVGDLNLFFYSAGGTRTKLLERNCGSLANINTTFDDSAPATFNSACPQAGSGGPYRGNEPLSNSNGQNSFGYWRIAIENNGSNSKTGTLTGFSISITGTVLGPPVIGPNSIVSTSSFVNDVVVAGDQIDVIGANLGPSDGIRADATKTLPTTLGSTSVTVDGVAAPLFYASDSIVQAHLPTTLTAGSTTKIQVTASTGSSSVVTLPVVSAKPGVFTFEAEGPGQAKAINQDGSLNGDGTVTGSDKPAPAGSVIAVYATGLGPLNPPISAGTPASTSTLSRITLPITASIGGRSATVTFAGAAPGQIGVYQVNLVVPLSAPSGANRLVIAVDGYSSQNGVTVQVR